MTQASDLGHLVCADAGPPSGFAHDPSLPLVLGSTDLSKYVVMTYDAVNFRFLAQVVSPSGNTTYGFDAVGNITINGNSIGSIPEIANAVLAAQAAATSATTSAIAAGTSATQAQNNADQASEDADSAQTNADLAQQYANAADGVVLPDGGRSAASSARLADSIAVLSRDLPIGGDMNADETYAAGFLNTERGCTATGLVNVTIPANIYTAAPGSARRWGLYTLKNATGSVKFIPDPGSTGLRPAIISARALGLHRFNDITNTLVNQITTAVIAVPASFTGRLLFIYEQSQNNNSPTAPSPVTFTAVGSGAAPPTLSFTTLQALPAGVTNFNVSDFFIAEAPIVTTVASNITFTFTGGPKLMTTMLGLYLIGQVNTGGTTRLITKSNPSGGNAVTATLAALAASSLVIAQSRQSGVSITGTTAGTFQSFSTNIGEIARGTSTGIDETAVVEGNAPKNFAFGIGSSTPSAAADFVAAGNFTSSASAARAAIALVAYPPTTVPGFGAVTLNKEDGRDTLVAPFGTAELWFDPDGLTVRCRMSRHLTEGAT